MKKERIIWFIVLLLLIVVSVMFLPNRTEASGQSIPDPFGSFYYTDKLSNEWICFYGERVNYSLGLDCERLEPCPCDSSERSVSTNDEKFVSSETLDPTNDPTSTPEPTKVEKPKCNAGRGNGSEGDPDCDPGNSGDHNQGGD